MMPHSSTSDHAIVLSIDDQSPPVMAHRCLPLARLRVEQPVQEPHSTIMRRPRRPRRAPPWISVNKTTLRTSKALERAPSLRPIFLELEVVSLFRLSINRALPRLLNLSKSTYLDVPAVPLVEIGAVLRAWHVGSLHRSWQSRRPYISNPNKSERLLRPPNERLNRIQPVVI